MSLLPYDTNKIQVRLAESEEEILKAQQLRYQVFYEEFGAIPTPQMQTEQRDFDPFDQITDHLVVVDQTDEKFPKIVGTYRLLRQKIAEQNGRFYTSDEYNIAVLLQNKNDLLELGRSCVLSPYRTRPILQKLWEGIAHYVADNSIGLMFGCASLHGTDINSISQQLSYLYHYHLAPPELRPVAVPDKHQNMNLHPKESLNVKKVFTDLPPLIKGYIRLGAYIGDGAVIDKQFNTTDVCIVLPSEMVKEKYVRHYERKTNKIIPAGEKMVGTS